MVVSFGGMAERRNLHVRLTDASYRALRSYAAEHGVSLGALVEAMGERLALYPEVTETGRWLVLRAREIDQQRRSRGD